MNHRLTLPFVVSALATVLALSLPLRAAAEAAFLGMQVQGISPAVAEALDLEPAVGVLVRDVALGGPAAEAGFLRGDLIVEFAGRNVDTFEMLVTTVGGLRAGQEVAATVLRRGARVKLGMRTAVKPESWRVTKKSFVDIPNVGLTLAASTPKARESFGLRWGSVGVLVTLLDPERAQGTDLQRGELIVQVNQEDVWEPDQVLAAYREAKTYRRTVLLLLVEGVGGYRFSLLPVR